MELVNCDKTPFYRASFSRFFAVFGTFLVYVFFRYLVIIIRKSLTIMALSLKISVHNSLGTRKARSPLVKKPLDKTN
jgi:hypothetical protein